MQIINGQAVAAYIKQQAKKECEVLSEAGKTPGLAVIIVGEDPASLVYVKNKITACKEVGINSFCYKLPADTDESTISDLIEKFNNDQNVDGILVQLPLPKTLNERSILSKIDVGKDVDGFSAEQMGKLLLGEGCLSSCTPSGVIQLLKYYNIPIAGKKAVIVGRSNTVGKPMALMLLSEDATVTICHSRTQNLSEITKTADILVVAIGKGKFIKRDMIKEGAVVIDVGMNRIDGKLCGDVDFDAVSEKCSFITPVPGGVGPMTVAMLINNTVQSAKTRMN
ncbi:MAG: bifunctional methylenetetrahydrofolate dehydrogenase/methenyltetrahydrofolate cyclohydrolase FolD [Clostridia bacterium]|nr:bifunctional methylenetetrahydrofolate dehydrogenase/methenyltetrahydrofolate cyclohydrolase FolD [Clostridia bacterium]